MKPLRHGVLPTALPLLTSLAILAGCEGDGPPVSQGQSTGRAPTSVWQEGPRLPAPVGNNAVAAIAGPEGITVLSFLGVDSTKVWSGVTNAAYRWDVGTERGWQEIRAVPGPGRLAATVQVVDEQAYLFGGYTVAEDGSEKSMPDVNVYDPAKDLWSRAADIPLPVDDAVSGLWRDSLIYLVSGWHDTENVSEVQIFDPAANTWKPATPIPGAPVFGHSGAIAADEIVYVGGAKIVDSRPRFVLDTAAWSGRIDPSDPTHITWQALPHPPGPPLYRAAGGVVGDLVVLGGGTDNPYNYNGIGYDRSPSAALRQLLAYDAAEGWVALAAPPAATMDHRTLGVAGGYVFLVGGMLEDQRVSDRVWYAELDALLASRLDRR